MNTIPETVLSASAPDACHQVLDALLLSWPDAPGDTLSSAHLDHLRGCRSCLQKWIAFEAAADLTTLLPSQGENQTDMVDVLKNPSAARHT